MRLKFQGKHIVDHVGVLKKDEQQPSQRVEDEAGRCRQVLASPHASEAQKMRALSTLYRLHYGG